MKSFKSKLRTRRMLRQIREKLGILTSIFQSPYQTINYNLAATGIEVIIDVGANVGQFAIDMRRSGFKGHIHSFEPVKQIFRKLEKTASKDPNWSVYNLGLGAHETKSMIHVSQNDGLSSSILEMNSIHLLNFPNSHTSYLEEILLSNVDTQLKLLGLDPKNCLLKIDVQGFESQVLLGASESLSKIPLLFIEASLVPLYREEKDLIKLLNLLSSFNHHVIDVYRGVQTKNGKLLQVDLLTQLADFES